MITGLRDKLPSLMTAEEIDLRITLHGKRRPPADGFITIIPERIYSKPFRHVTKMHLKLRTPVATAKRVEYACQRIVGERCPVWCGAPGCAMVYPDGRTR